MKSPDAQRILYGMAMDCPAGAATLEIICKLNKAVAGIDRVIPHQSQDTRGGVCEPAQGKHPGAEFP